jgi:hypothetical protein
MAWPIVSDNPCIQAHYEACREEGTSHNLAEMFAFREVPRGNTDKTFLTGHCNGSQFEGQDYAGDYYASVARAGGVNPKGKVYLSGLADFPGDPKAWVSGRGDVERVAKERGYSVEGSVTVKPRERTGAPHIEVAEDIVDAEVNRIAASVPDSHMVDTVDLKEQVIAKRKGNAKC